MPPNKHSPLNETQLYKPLSLQLVRFKLVSDYLQVHIICTYCMSRQETIEYPKTVHTCVPYA